MVTDQYVGSTLIQLNHSRLKCFHKTPIITGKWCRMATALIESATAVENRPRHGMEVIPKIETPGFWIMNWKHPPYVGLVQDLETQ
jgi:hypothetical protein